MTPDAAAQAVTTQAARGAGARYNVERSALLALICTGAMTVSCGSPTSPTPSMPSPAASLALRFAGSQDTVETFTIGRGSYVLTWTATDSSKSGCVVGMQIEPIDHEELVTVLVGDIAAAGETRRGEELAQLDGGRYALAVKSPCAWTAEIAPA